MIDGQYGLHDETAPPRGRSGCHGHLSPLARQPDSEVVSLSNPGDDFEVVLSTSSILHAGSLLRLVGVSLSLAVAFWGCGDGEDRSNGLPHVPAIKSISEPPRPKSTQASPTGLAANAIRGHRAVDVWLIDALDDAAIQPGIRGDAPPISCFDNLARSVEAPVVNPLSPIQAAFRTHHWRLGPSAGAKRRDIRDAFAFRMPRRLTWSVVASAEPRLQFAYRIGCRRPHLKAWVDVEVSRLGSPMFRRRVPLHVGGEGPLQPWRDVVVELPHEHGEAVELSLAFGFDGDESAKPLPAIALANPRVTGRPLLERKARDLNLLLIIIDALRADLVAPNRRTDVPHVTPYLSRFIRRGASFRRAFAVSNQTRASTLSVLTSQPPSLGGFRTSRWLVTRQMSQRYYGVGAATRPPLLTRTLRAAGYMPVTIGHNRFLFADHPMGLDAGFDRIIDDAHWSHDTKRLTEKALAFVDAHRDERFFLYLNLVTPHLPYAPPKRHLDQVLAATGGNKEPAHISAKYLAEVAFMDEQVGRVLERLDDHGIAQRTLVVVLADHGEVFAPAHACWSKRFGQNCHHNHGLTLYGEELHVPLAFVGPKSIRSGSVAPGDISLLNVAPTILDLLGLPEDKRHVGRSLRPELEGREAQPEAIYAEARRSVAFQLGGWKLHMHHRLDDAWPASRRGLQSKRGERPKIARFQLFDLERDPHEINNLALGGHKRLQLMLDEMGRHRAWMAGRISRAPSAGSTPPLSTQFERSVPALNTFLLRSNGNESVFSATIEALSGGRLRCVSAGEGSTCEQADGHTIRLRLKASEVVSRLDFESAPWDEPLKMTATLNGASMTDEQLRVGSFGLKLFGPRRGLSGGADVLRRAATQVVPRIRTKGPVGVFYWRSLPPDSAAKGTDQGGEGAGNLPVGPEAFDGGDEAMSDELRKALKAMGYAQ